MVHGHIITRAWALGDLATTRLGSLCRREVVPDEGGGVGWGVSNAEIGVLVVMHAIAAAVITRGLTSVRR
jgi:hypothetical protein